MRVFISSALAFSIYPSLHWTYLQENLRLLSHRMHNGSSKDKHYKAGGSQKGTLYMVLFVYL
jgi:hypothetical protein